MMLDRTAPGDLGRLGDPGRLVILLRVVTSVAVMLTIGAANVIGASTFGAGQAPLHLSLTPVRDTVGAALWNAWLVAVPVAAVIADRRGYHRRARVVYALTWSCAVVASYRGWIPCADPGRFGCPGRLYIARGTVGMTVLGALVVIFGAVVDRERLQRHRRSLVVALALLVPVTLLTGLGFGALLLRYGWANFD